MRAGFTSLPNYIFFKALLNNSNAGGPEFYIDLRHYFIINAVTKLVLIFDDDC